MAPFDRYSTQRALEAAIVERAATHAVSVHEDQDTAPLTHHGLASCAASMAMVLTDPCHPNHLIAWQRTEGGSNQEAHDG